MSLLGILGSCEVPPKERANLLHNGIELYFKEPVRVIESGDACLLLTGSVFDTQDNELLNSETALENAYGTYAYVHCNLKTGRTIIGTDKLGHHGLFYCQKDRNLLFGNFIPHLKYRLKRVSIDMEAWDEILNTGDLLDRKTSIKEIKRLLCGEKLIIERGVVRRHRFWSYTPAKSVGLTQYINENNELLAEALLKTKNHSLNKLIPLTGGQDSRRIVLAADKCGMEFNTITQVSGNGENRDVDTTLAKELATQLSLDHQVSVPSKGRQQAADKIYKDYWLGFESHDHHWAVPLSKNIKQKSLIYDGIVGDVTVNGGYFALMPSYYQYHANTERVLDMLLPSKALFIPNSQHIDASLRARTRAELENYPNDYNRLVLFMLFNHTRRNIASWFQLFNLSQHQACMPFAYQPLFLQSLSLDLPLHKDRLVQGLCMQKLNPKIASLPSTREQLSQDFYTDYDVPFVESVGLFPKELAISSEVYRYLKIKTRDRLMDRLADLIDVDQLKEKNQWRTEPLKRMSIFLDWLNTDESDLPALFTGVAPFIQKHIDRYGLVTPSDDCGKALNN